MKKVIEYKGLILFIAVLLIGSFALNENVKRINAIEDNQANIVEKR